MIIKWPVIRWQMRQMRFWNIALGAIAAVYVLTRSEPFASISTSPVWFPVVHAAAIAWFLGRSNTPATGFLHLQGFSRDTLWWHTVMSAGGCALWAWIPAAILILTPLRSSWQDLLQNPSFPYMGPAEHRFAWIALWEYGTCIPLGLYAASRWGHPARSNAGGFVCAAILTLMFVVNLAAARPWYTNFALSEYESLFALSATASILVLFIGRQLFREREVLP